MTLPPTLDIAASCVRPGGHAFLWKGSGRVEEKAKHPEWNERWDEGLEFAFADGNVAVCNFILSR